MVDTDIIAREVVQSGSPALEEIRHQFGQDVIRGDGSLDRAALRKIVFADPARRSQLEAILHPRIRDEAYRQAEAAPGDYVIMVVPLLYESPIRDVMDRILVVDCDEQMQLERLLARDDESEAQARRIMATQASRAERLSIADDVIANDGDIEQSRRATLRLHDKYLDLARQKA